MSLFTEIGAGAGEMLKLVYIYISLYLLLLYIEQKIRVTKRRHTQQCQDTSQYCYQGSSAKSCRQDVCFCIACLSNTICITITDSDGEGIGATKRR